MVCQGNSLEFCGAGDRLNLYQYTGTDLPTTPTDPPPPVGGGGGGGGVPTTVFPVLSSELPTGWAYNACWVCVSTIFDQIVADVLLGTTLTAASSTSRPQSLRRQLSKAVSDFALPQGIK